MAHEVDRLVSGERVEAKQHGVAARRTPRGTLIEKLAARQGEHERPPRPAPAGRTEPLDQVEHRRSQRVGVFENQGDRVVARQCVDQRDEAGLDVVDESRLLAPLAAYAEEQSEPLDGSVEVALDAAGLDQLAQAAPDRVGRIGGLDARELAHDRRGGRERRAVPEAARLTAKDADRRAHACSQLLRQPRLADAGLADDRDQHRLARRAREAEALAEDGLLADPVDERDGAARRARGQALDRKRIERFGEAFRLDPASPPE